MLAPERRRPKTRHQENDGELSFSEDELSDAPDPPDESEFVIPETAPAHCSQMVRTQKVLSELHTLVNADTSGIVGQYNHLYGGAYPEVSAPPLSTESDTSAYASESDVLSEAGRYVRRHRGVKARTRKARAAKPQLAEEELRCAHCAMPNPDGYMGYVTVFRCCDRRSHTVCVTANPTASALLHGEFDPSPPESVEQVVRANAQTPCLSCLRPAQLLPHRELLVQYIEYLGDDETETAPGQPGGLFNRIFRRDQHPPESSSSSSNSNKDEPPKRESIDALLKRGESLESIVARHGLHRIDDDYAESWERLGFTKHTLLHRLSETDLLFYMRNYDVHPHALRHHFDIKLADLWVGEEPRASNIRDYMERSPATATQDACEKFRVLSPTRLAIMGFDTHHLLQMGFVKADFARFPAYCLADWVNTLGMCKPHWWLLKLGLEDLTTKPVGRGWSVGNLVSEWRMDITDLQSMGLINVDTMLHQLDGARESPEPPNPSAPRQRAARLRATDVYLSRKYGVW